MIYGKLLQSIEPDRVARVGIIGTGHYATAVITQSPYVPRLHVTAVCDLDVDAARQALRRAGFADEACAVCHGREEALRAIERGQRVIAPDASLLMELPVDVIVESTGVPEAGARHAREAIRHGKHVAMVSKETDVVVGPILKHLADRAGVVYTAVDGDQHGLLMALVEWARLLGLEVLCGGKSVDTDLVFASESGTVPRRGAAVPLSTANAELFRPLVPGRVAEILRDRRQALGRRGAIAGYDVVEMAIAANATGLVPDVEELHGPVVRIPEIPEALCPAADGGILQHRGVIDAVSCLQQPDAPGMGGGVFVVVSCENDYSRSILTTKGLIPNSRGTAALIYRPYHLCGVETPISLLCAGLLGVATGASEYRPSFDVVARAAEDLKAGERIGSDHSPKLKALMRPARPVTEGAPLPLHMANGNPLRVDVPAGTILTPEMVQPPADSSLWALRAEQDRHFLTESSR
jgi:predicted homoserine dehydrogenase-like protein